MTEAVTVGVKFPIFVSQDQFHQMQTQWAAILNPWFINPMSQGLFLEQVSLKSGNNIIPHLLQRIQQGWYITDINAAVVPYRSAPFNSLTLNLNASSACVVNLYVF